MQAPQQKFESSQPSVSKRARPAANREGQAEEAPSRSNALSYQIAGIQIRLPWLAAAIVLLLLCSLHVWQARPTADPTQPPAAPTLDWLMQPVEVRGEGRVTWVNRQIKAVTTAPGDDAKLWVVGEAATILHSADAGVTWQLQYPPKTKAESPTQSSLQTSTTPSPEQQEQRVKIRRLMDRADQERVGIYEETAKTLGQPLGDTRRLLEQALRLPTKQLEGGWYNNAGLDGYQTKIVREALGRLKRLNTSIEQYSNELRKLDNSTAPARQTAALLPVTLGYSGDLTAVRFSSAEQGVALGNGVQLVTDNGGSEWVVQRVNQQDPFNRVQQSSPVQSIPLEQQQAIELPDETEPVYALTPEGKLYRGGQLLLATGSRTAAVPQHWPSPLYWLATFLVMAFLGMSIRRAPPPAVTARASIADRAISDRPLEDPQQDVLNLNEVAQGLSQYLRNEHTTAPLTIAVTGPWGSGKSSVLNLLSRDLNQSGFRPVRFNAWHQHAEDEIFSALLQSLREHAIPSALSLAGIRYRWRLLSTRAQKQPRMTLLLVGFSLFGLAYLTQFPPAEIWSEFQKSGYDLFPVLQKYAPALTALVGVVGFLSGTKTRFGLRDAWGRLFSLLSLRTPKEAEKLGQRERFKREFAAITEALKPAALVIMIDDLDRCQPKQIMETLKTVNFLADCGDCFLVLGMAREMIERAIADQYDDLLSQADIDDEQADADPKKLRRDFARQYLEKMVNIEVPVPLFTPESAGQLLQQGYAANNAIERNWWQALRCRTLTCVLLVSLFAVAGGYFGRDHAESKRQAIAVVAAASKEAVLKGSSTPPAGGERSDYPSTTPAPTPDLESGKSKPREPFALQAAKAPSREPLWLLLIVPLLLMALAAVIALAVRRGAALVATTDDSQEFQDSLAVWASAIVGMHKSPRAVKRFVNKLRFLAMRQRVAKTEWLTEEQIICLAVLRDWAQRQFDGNATSGLEAALAESEHVPESIKEAFEFQSLKPSPEAAMQFDAMASGVYVRA